jgi:hypothetical protein
LRGFGRRFSLYYHSLPQAGAEPGLEEESPAFAATVEEPRKERTPRLDWAGLLKVLGDAADVRIQLARVISDDYQLAQARDPLRLEAVHDAVIPVTLGSAGSAAVLGLEL